ncbi:MULTISPECIES: hypothetical protein [Clostridium]|jgi:antitoxin component of RelBE/YafQ-DinJ toxin-antitoxin module|uniref:hypothetical protein n=1 Tax=Clostridium TaxID=1485 RepID=UPI002ACEB1C1|nr:hypothetical protein [Clostridium perfringens]MDZ7548819.1 hypothetical protein [Clostridium perfringens]
MQKPVDLIIEDSKEAIYSILNNSGLSITIINMMLKEISDNANRQNCEYLSLVRKDYNQALKSKSEKIDVEKEKIK